MRNDLILGLILCLVPFSFAMAQNAKQTRQKTAPSANQQTPSYNPYRAVHDVEVGKFYLKRGDLAGAIARFKEALLYKDNYAEPRLLLGEIYEKKNDAATATAVSYYEEYLKILPNSAESKKVRERIARLQEKMRKDPSVAKR